MCFARVVQGGLNRVIGQAASARLATSGVFAKELEQAIQLFQRMGLGLASADGRVDPRGKTWRGLADTLSLKRIIVSLDNQWLDALEDGRRVFGFPCVSGDGAHPTDKGTFRVSRKAHPYRSRTYDVDMNYAMFFTADGKAIHQYHGFAGLTAVRFLRHNASDWQAAQGTARDQVRLAWLGAARRSQCTCALQLDAEWHADLRILRRPGGVDGSHALRWRCLRLRRLRAVRRRTP